VHRHFVFSLAVITWHKKPER